MATVFQETTQLAAITDQKPVRLVIPKFQNGKLLITKIAGEVRPNYQIMYSLGSDAFITAFNQRLSTWTIHGLHIPGGCDGQNFKGEPAFVDLYRKFNIRTAKQPLDMAFNDIVLVGFFIGMTIQDYSQNGVDGFAWETPFMGRMNNLLEDPDPIVVAEGAAAGAVAPDPVRQGNLEDGTYDPDAHKQHVKDLIESLMPPPVGPAEVYDTDEYLAAFARKHAAMERAERIRQIGIDGASGKSIEEMLEELRLGT